MDQRGVVTSLCAGRWEKNPFRDVGPNPALIGRQQRISRADDDAAHVIAIVGMEKQLIGIGDKYVHVGAILANESNQEQLVVRVAGDDAHITTILARDRGEDVG